MKHHIALLDLRFSLCRDVTIEDVKMSHPGLYAYLYGVYDECSSQEKDKLHELLAQERPLPRREAMAYLPQTVLLHCMKLYSKLHSQFLVHATCADTSIETMAV